MKWKRVKSRDVIDIRGASRGPAKGGCRSPVPIPGGVAGLGGGAGLVVVLVIVAINAFSGGGGGFDLQNAFGTGTAAPGGRQPGPDPARRGPVARSQGLLDLRLQRRPADLEPDTGGRGLRTRPAGALLGCGQH